MDELIERRFRVHDETGLLMHQRKPIHRHIYNNIDQQQQQQRKNNIYSTNFNINQFRKTKHRPIIFNKYLNEVNFNQIKQQQDFDEDNNDSYNEVKNNENESDNDSNYEINDIEGSRSSHDSASNILQDESLRTNEIVRATSKRSSSMSHSPTKVTSLPNVKGNEAEADSSNLIESRLTLLDEPVYNLNTHRLRDSHQIDNQHHAISSPASTHNQGQFTLDNQEKNSPEFRNKPTSKSSNSPITNSRETKTEQIYSSDRPDNHRHNSQQKQQLQNNNSSKNLTKIGDIEENRSNQFLVAAPSELNTVNAYDEQQHLVFLASSSILFLLIILIFYGWLSKRRSTTPKSCTKPLFSSSSNTSSRTRRRLSIFASPISSLLKTLRFNSNSNFTHQHKKQSSAADVIDGLIENDAGERKNFATFACAASAAAGEAGAGEQLQLLERKSETFAVRKSFNCNNNDNDKNDDVDDDIIQVVETYPNLNDNERSTLKCVASANQADTEKCCPSDKGSFHMGNKMVILKRKFAKSSLVVTAKRSTKPRVKLINGRVKKFIDEEANDIQQNQLVLNPQVKEPWRFRALNYIINSFRGSSKLEKTVAIEENELRNVSANHHIEITDAQSELESSGVQNQNTSNSSSVSNEEYVSALNTHSAGASSFNAEIHPTPSSGLTSRGQTNLSDANQIPVGNEDKLSPNNLNLFNLDCCSSISGCSLFLSPSPIDTITSKDQHEHRQTQQQLDVTTNPTCDCSYENRVKNSLLPGTLLDANQISSNIYNNDYMRTRSQGLVGSSGFASGDSNSALPYTRPCCSVSPTALNQHLYQSALGHQIRGAQALATDPSIALSCCNSASPTYQNHQQPIQLHTENNSKNGAAFDVLGNPMLRLAHGNNIKSSSLTNTNKFCNIKRQYENYYDDEQEEAYRRLTASIGMEFGLGFHHHHHHHPSSVLTTNEDLMQFASANANRYTCMQQAGPIVNNQNHQFIPQNSINFNQHQICKCCQNPQSATRNTHETSAFYQNELGHFQQKQQTTSNELQNPYLFKDCAGSVGELMSSPCTSLGGSDSGFVSSTINNGGNYTANVCRNPLCQCQYSGQQQQQQQQQAELAMPPPPMSILVQQPSLVTPPPPATSSNQLNQGLNDETNTVNLEELSQKDEQKLDQDHELSGTEVPEQMNSPLTTSLEVSPQHSPNRASNFTSGTKPKWRQHVRRLSQRSPASGDTAMSNVGGVEHGRRSTRSSPRRMSIAGDQVPSSLSSTNHSQLHHSRLTQGISPNHVFLQHRASIGTADGCGTLNNNNNQQYNHYHQQQHAGTCNSQGLRLNHLNHLHQQQQLNSHRPSDASLYEGQYYSGNAKSSYSSSSSSGIGINGSTCATNTPTSVHPNGSFAIGSRLLDSMGAETFFGGHLMDTESMLRARSHHNQTSSHRHHPSSCHHQPTSGCANHTAPYVHSLQMSGAVDPSTIALTMNPACFCQQPACQSRKYSLPVQLESQAAERLQSPNMDETQLTSGRLLFEKNNLQRVDSTNSQSVFLQGSQATATTSNSSSGIAINMHQQRLPGEAVQVSPNQQQRRISGTTDSQMENRKARLIDSRRSSQTITRQSSFWLEDNSIDSMGKSSLASDVNGQQSENGSQLDLNPLPIDAAVDQQQQDHQQNQRPSLSSLILSGDSIESVKLRPGFENCQNTQNENEAQSNQQLSSQSTTQNIDSSAYQEGPSSAPLKPSSNHFGFFPPSSSSSTSSAASSNRKRHHFRNLAHMRNRLPSSSTSSNGTTTTSSPSPDFGRPSDRILAAKSSGSTLKRHSIGKSSRHNHPRKYPRLGSSAKNSSFDGSKFSATQKNSSDTKPDSKRNNKDESEDESSSTETFSNKHLAGASSTKPTTSSADLEKQDSKETSESQHSCDTDIDGVFSNVNNERISDVNSSSLERQCKELWKLRAALHDDSCVGDNWSNYHQRLNRRYDSGYKSIENQLSSSLEGNIMANGPAGSNNVNTLNQPTVGTSPTESNQQLQLQLKRHQACNTTNHALAASERPLSGCSGLIETILPEVTDASGSQENIEQKQCKNPNVRDDDVNSDLSGGGIEYKLAELGLEEVTLDYLMINDEPELRECNSRSSKGSSEEEASKKKTPTCTTPASPN